MISPEAKAVLDNAAKRARKILADADTRAERIMREPTPIRAPAIRSSDLRPLRLYLSPKLAEVLHAADVAAGRPKQRIRVWQKGDSL